MTSLDIIREALGSDLTSEDGEPNPLKLLPGLTDAEISAFEAQFPVQLPPSVRELLGFCRGFTGGWTESVDFTGDDGFILDDIFPYGLPFASDGTGNFWVIDLLPGEPTDDWGPIYYAGHDPAVIVYQSPTLTDFLTELFKLSRPPYKSAIGEVCENDVFEVWEKSPEAVTQPEALSSADPILGAFDAGLDPAYAVIDMRSPVLGMGFPWGRAVPGSIRRDGILPIFAYQPPAGLLKKIAARSRQ